MESTSRIYRYVRGYDPGFISKFRCPYVSRRIVRKSHRSAGDNRLQRPTKSRIVCCPQVSPGNCSLLADCFSQKEDDGELPSDELCQVTGGIVALGKFDALHIGHRELAIQASKAGNPYLLSFVGMAEVLGWEHRVPIVAKCDRKRVLSSWAPYCGNVIPLEYHVEFSSVRHLTPQQFVERLSKELRVSGVVAGENYRFGYKASGNATELVRLCEQYGLEAYIVSPVMDRRQLPPSTGSKAENSMEMGQVSSTRVRHALDSGDMEYVSDLLGRSHRLVLTADQKRIDAGQRMSASKSCMLNQPPKDGLYESCTLLADDAVVGSCNVLLDTTHVHINLDEAGPQVWDPFLDCQTLGIEFGVSDRLR